MAHEDGRCAAVAETIYVQNDTTTCSDSATTDPGFGTVMKPLCSMQPVSTLLSTSKDLVLVRGSVSGGSWTFSGQGAPQTSIVGQNSGFIAALGVAPAFAMSSGSIFVRDLKITSGGSDGIDERGGTLTVQNVTIAGSSTSGAGISATGGTLTTSKVTVDSCAGGGILLGGAAFDIENTTVTNNGPGPQGTSGGIVINALPTTGVATVHLVTVQNNKSVGMTCAPSAPITTASGVYATGNTGVDIAQTCGFSSCPAPSTTCGAQ